jgi:trans-2-enoyl-CoA reductase
MLADLGDVAKSIEQMATPNLFASDPKRIAIGASSCFALGAIVTAVGAFGFTRRDL